MKLEQYQTSLPTIDGEMDDGAWSFFLQSQQCILKCTQFTVNLKRLLDAGDSPEKLNHQAFALDQEIDSILSRHLAISSDMKPTVFRTTSEHDLAASLRLQAIIKLNSARIKLHRYRAFHDVPIFTRKHCDLQPTGADGIQSVV